MKAAKKIKMETPVLQSAGCKDQFKHNSAVLEHIEATERHIRDAELREALEELDLGKKIVKKRNQLVLLADTEEDG